MARYRLLSPHYSEEDKLLDTDTEVGDGTMHKWTRPPTVEMVALDEEGHRLLERERVRAREFSSQDNRIAPIDDLPLTMGEVRKQYDAEVDAAAAETQAMAAPPARMPSLADRRGNATLTDRIKR